MQFRHRVGDCDIATAFRMRLPVNRHCDRFKLMISRRGALGNRKQVAQRLNEHNHDGQCDNQVSECAAIHGVLKVCNAIDDDANCRGKTDLKRIVSMFTRLVQRTETVSEDRIEYEYEYEYRDAEYDYEPSAVVLTNNRMRQSRRAVCFANGEPSAPT